MKMKKVRSIVSTTAGGEDLYYAAAKVFELPDARELKAWLAHPDAPAPNLPEQIDPHIGPQIALLRSFQRRAEAALILTDGGRMLYVKPWFTRVEVHFATPWRPEGSLAAAGQVIYHLWQCPGDHLATVVFTDGEVVDVDEYPGPVAPDLGRARWDGQYRLQHPDLAAAVPTAE